MDNGSRDLLGRNFQHQIGVAHRALAGLFELHGRALVKIEVAEVECVTCDGFGDLDRLILEFCRNGRSNDLLKCFAQLVAAIIHFLEGIDGIGGVAERPRNDTLEKPHLE